MEHLTLALDWTPNINHIGFFVAKENGLYRDVGIELNIIDPSEDDYSLTPAKKVELGKANFALCPTESIISYRTKKEPFDLIAIAAVFQQDLSAIAVKESSNIFSPKDLDGKSYGSYEARYEDKIVQQMILNDGGKGAIEVSYPNKLGIWDRVIAGGCDATWVFLNWEGIEAENFEEKLRYFKMKDYGIPYSYSPVIAASEATLADKKSAYTAFLSATKKGFLQAAQHPTQAVEVLQKVIPLKDKNINLNKALAYSAPHFGNENNWGIMESKVISEFLEWVYEHKMEKQQLKPSTLFTNELNLD
jgi:ABC-type nitrate/sulfonate/bicarbonate transport system substrate-binding protein